MSFIDKIKDFIVLDVLFKIKDEKPGYLILEFIILKAKLYGYTYKQLVSKNHKDSTYYCKDICQFNLDTCNCISKFTTDLRKRTIKCKYNQLCKCEIGETILKESKCECIFGDKRIKRLNSFHKIKIDEFDSNNIIHIIGTMTCFTENNHN